jgi:hypothetical protein
MTANEFGFDLIERIRTVGYIGIIAIIFAVSGLFSVVFLPGDGLLLTAGLRAARYSSNRNQRPEGMPAQGLGWGEGAWERVPDETSGLDRAETGFAGAKEETQCRSTPTAARSAAWNSNNTRLFPRLR